MSGRSNCTSCGIELHAYSTNNLCPSCLSGERSKDESKTVSPTNGPMTTDAWAVEGGSVLASIDVAFGTMPRVRLRSTDEGAKRLSHRPADGTEPCRSARYRIDGEIASGGMGDVLKGRDHDLGRDVALKVLREELHENADMVRRFVEEAQIGGQLQHPGIVPIYELGTFSNSRPFFSMKLVKGHTLSALLADRKPDGWAPPAKTASAAPDVWRCPGYADLPRFVSIFESIAQTVAYAHARGVIHRDLKPLNVMVGSFGEVQVMDWGLAKVLPGGGIGVDPQSGKLDGQETAIATARSASVDSDLSHAGSVMGTPSYMAPEQARGEIDRIDERADVFALGSILCEILSGEPAFLGRSSGEILRKAALGDLIGATTRLDGCGADAELVALAKDCLGCHPEERPRAAGAVSERVTAYLAGVQEKLRKSERERAVAEARAVHERQQRRLQLGLATAVLALLTTCGLATAYYLQERSARAAAVAKVLGEASTLRDVASAHPEDVGRWQTVLGAVSQAERTAAGDANALARVEVLRAEAQAGKEAAQRDNALLDRLVDIRSAKADDRDGSATDAAYGDAFREANLDMASISAVEAGEKIKARPPAVALAIAAALDVWAAIRRDYRKDNAGARSLVAAARVADPDPWRNDLRHALALPEKGRRKDALKQLAGTANFDNLGPVSLALLGGALSSAGDDATAETVLRKAQRRNAGDIWVNYDLARVLERLNRRNDAIRFYSVARAIRPETAHELAQALDDADESDEALEVLLDLVRIRPHDARHLSVCGSLLKHLGRGDAATAMLDRAITAAREAARRRPDLAAVHMSLGYALEAQGSLDESITEYHKAIQQKPDDATGHGNLAGALYAKGDPDGAIAEWREAIRLEPNLAKSYNNLGYALQRQGKFDDAVAAYREVIRLEPESARAHRNLGVILWEVRHDTKAAESAFREAIRLKPGYAAAHASLGNVLWQQGKRDLAIAEFHEAIRFKPDDADAHNNMASVLTLDPDPARRDPARAIEHALKATGLQPRNAAFINTLATAQFRASLPDVALSSFRKSMELSKGGDPYDWFFLAMIEHGRGNAAEGARWFDKSVAWMRQQTTPEADLVLIWTEAAKLTGLTGPPVPK